jgi:hypothetical protein
MENNFWVKATPAFPLDIPDIPQDVMKWLLYIRCLDESLHESKNLADIELEGLKTTASISSSIYNLKREFEYVMAE